MQPTKELIDQLYRERVLRARAMDPEMKLLAGARLFDQVCRVMTAGIKSEYPDAKPNEVQAILKERLALARRLENIP